MRVADADLNLLVVLDAVVVERNVTCTVKRLRISQPELQSRPQTSARDLQRPLLVRVGALGIRPVQIMATGDFALLPALPRGPRHVGLDGRRGAVLLAEQYGLVLREPPVGVPDIVQTLHTSPHNDHDPAHISMRELFAEGRRLAVAATRIRPSSMARRPVRYRTGALLGQ